MKKNQILGICILTAVIGISIYVFKSRQYVESNPFANPNSKGESLGAIFTFQNERYSLNDLNFELKEAFYASKVRQYQEFRTAIYLFAIRRRQTPELDINGLLPVPEFFQTITKQQDFDEWYEENKGEYIGKENPRSHAIIDYKVKVISQAVATDGAAFEKEGLLKLNLPIPKAPLEILDLDAYPKAGDPSSENQYVFITSYLCEECFKFNKGIRNIFLKEKDDIYITLIPYTIDPTSVDAILSDSALCVHKYEPKAFWLYHNKLISNRAIYKKKDLPNAWVQIKKTLREIKIKEDNIIGCLKDKNISKEFTKMANRVKTFKPRKLPILYHNKIDTDLFN